MDKEQEAFEKWIRRQWSKRTDPFLRHCNDVEPQYTYQDPDTDLAYIAWKARAALDMSEELATCLEVLISDEVRWHSSAQTNEFIDEVLNKYHERKI